MKNIHVLPTDKRSKLANKDSNNKLELSEKNTFFVNGFGFTPQNIYITSDEEIKEGDWMIRNNEQPIKVTKDFFWDFGVRYYKIILTTDQDLIKDGVQAIDDEFLEWFVKNPSCEEVEVQKWFDGVDFLEYKIIIPKEEPITLGKIIPKERVIGLEEPKQKLEKYSERFDNKENEIVEGIFNPETWGKRMVDNVPKQETLEEAAEIFVNNRFTKQICGDESYPDILASKSSIVESHILFAKWQQEQIGKSEFLQRLRGTLSDAEARRLIFEQFKNK